MTESVPRAAVLLTAMLWLQLMPAAFGQTIPAEIVGPRPAGRVIDATGRLTADDQREITELLDGIAAQTRGDMMVVVIPSTLGSQHRQFATDLFNRWRLGAAGRNDGLLLFAALEDRRAEIILGDGLDDAARRAASQRVMNGVMIPEFKQGRPARAIRRAALACATEILGSRTEIPSDAGAMPVPVAIAGEDRTAAATPVADGRADGVAADAPPPNRPRSEEPLVVPLEPDWLPWGAIAALGGGGAAMGAGGYGVWRLATRRRRRSCRRCRVPMIKLDELLDDGRLGESERTEERIGSVDYDVWTCPLCPLVEKLRYPTLFTRYARCPACKAVTELVTTSRLRSPTTLSEGLEEVTESCQNCGRRSQFTRSIPRVEESRSSSIDWSSTSSSFSSSSSFGGGGGHSSGGGASGSW